MDTTIIQAKPLPDPLPPRINLGCGWDIREGWLNVDLFDFHNPDLVADVTELPMLPDGAFQEVLAQDVLEHLPRGKTGPALAEWARLLAPNGTITLRVPSLPDAAAMLSRPERQSPENCGVTERRRAGPQPLRSHPGTPGGLGRPCCYVPGCHRRQPDQLGSRRHAVW